MEKVRQVCRCAGVQVCRCAGEGGRMIGVTDEGEEGGGRKGERKRKRQEARTKMKRERDPN